MTNTTLPPCRSSLLIALLPLLVLAGCVEGNWQFEETRDDIVVIRQFPPAVPWLYDESGRVTGMQVRVYFVSARTERGAYVAGPILVDLHGLTPSPEGGYERELIHTWKFEAEEAAGLRVRRESVMGDSYGLVLRWPPDLNLAGREIQLTYHYKRKDGQVITRRSSRFRVPAPRGPHQPEPLHPSEPAQTAPTREAPGGTSARPRPHASRVERR